MALLGHPILGDKRYGGFSLEDFDVEFVDNLKVGSVANQPIVSLLYYVALKAC